MVRWGSILKAVVLVAIAVAAVVSRPFSADCHSMELLVCSQPHLTSTAADASFSDPKQQVLVTSV